MKAALGFNETTLISVEEVWLTWGRCYSVKFHSSLTSTREGIFLAPNHTDKTIGEYDWEYRYCMVTAHYLRRSRRS